MSDLAVDENVGVGERGHHAGNFWSHLYHTTRRTLFCSYTNVLLVFVPIGIAAGTLGWSAEAVFVFNFLAIIPLAPLIAFLMDDLWPSAGQGHTSAELIKGASGNAVETLIGIVAVCRGNTLVVRSSLLGSVLAYALLVFGGCFLIAGYGEKKVTFDRTIVNTISSLIMAVSITLIVPLLMSVTSSASDSPDSRTDSDIPILSHAIAIVLAIIFVIYEHFRKWFLKDFLYSRSDQAATQEDHQSDRNDQPASHERHESVAFAASTHILRLCAMGCVLLCTTLCVMICAFHLVGSVDGLAKALNISTIFISLVLIPPTGYSAKSVTIVAMARRNQMDSVMRTVLINILQIVLFIIPVLILFGWIVNQPFILNFNIFEGIVLFLTLVVITCTIQNGKANYFDGIMLIGTYILIAAAFYVRPGALEILSLRDSDRRNVVARVLTGNILNASVS